MKKKIFLGLLVVLLVGILTFTVFACGDKKPKPTPTPTPTPTPDIEDYDVAPVLSDVVAAVDNTLKGISEIEDEASVSARIYVDVNVKGKAYNVALDIAGSVDEGTAGKNWAKIDADVLGVKVSLFAVNVDGKETLYVAQNILNKDVEWSKLSQFEEANVLSEKASKGVIEMVGKLLQMDVVVEKGKNGQPDKTEKFDKLLDSGIVSQFAGDILDLVGAIAGSLFMPGKGANNEFKVDGGYSIAINFESINKLLGSALPMIGGLGIDLSKYSGIINLVGGILLGGTLDIDEGVFTPGEETPTIEIGAGVKNNLFTGLSIYYGTEDVKVKFGLDNIAINNTSAAPAAADLKAVKGAEELAINLGLDIELEAIEGGYATVDLNVYPNASMTFDEDGYVALDLSKLYAEVIVTMNMIEDEENEPEQYVVAQYNADGYEDIYVDLNQIAYALNGDATGGSGLIYRIPVNLQEKFDKMIAEQKASKEEGNEEEPEAKNAGEDEKEGNIVDEIMGLFTKGEDGKVNIMGAVMALAGKLGDIKDAVTSLADFVDTNTEGQVTIDVEALIKNLLAKDGLIGGMTSDTTFDLYKGADEKEKMTLAELMAPDAVLGNVVALINTMVYEGYADGKDDAVSYTKYFENHNEVSVADAIALIGNFTGATVVEDNFYKNMSITLAGYAQKGIGASIAATLNDKSLKLGFHANLIDNKTEYVDVLSGNYYENTLYVMDEEYNATDRVVSNDTSVDGGDLLFNTIKGIFNRLTNMDNYQLDVFYWTSEAPSEDNDVEGGSYENPYATTGGEIALPMVDWSGEYYIAVVMDGAGTITLAGTEIGEAGICFETKWGGYAIEDAVLYEEQNEEYETVLMGDGVIEITEAGTYIILVKYYTGATLTLTIA